MHMRDMTINKKAMTEYELYLSEKYSGTYMDHASTQKQIATREEEMMNYRNYTIDHFRVHPEYTSHQSGLNTLEEQMVD